MRSTRRRLLDTAGVILLASLLARAAFLITGLRTYATRPEIPYRILEMAILLLAALFTYFFSYRFGFVPMTAACLIGLYAPVKEIITGSHITIGCVYPELHADGYIFDVLLIVGLLLLAAVSVIINPRFPRSETTEKTIRMLSFIVMLDFVASAVYQTVLLIITLSAETYPGEFTTKYFFAAIATDAALVMTGLACFMTAGIRPSERRRRSDSYSHAAD